jgi:hypothetical protein
MEDVTGVGQPHFTKEATQSVLSKPLEISELPTTIALPQPKFATGWMGCSDL